VGNGRFCRTRCVILKGRKWCDRAPIPNTVYHGDGESITQIGSQGNIKTAAIFRKTQLNRAVGRTNARSFDSPTACNSTVINREIVNVSVVVRLNTRFSRGWSLGRPNRFPRKRRGCRDLSEKLNSTGRSDEQTHVVLILPDQYAGFP
jgi:hypothetical protein